MDGILIVKKEKGYTSHDIVAKVKKILRTKVGHTGTLDPMATGVLPLLLGNGTKLSKYLIEHDKVYEATIQLGKKTDTADSEGNIVEEKEIDNVLFSEEKIEEIFENLVGEQMQKPPIYSAIKIKGKKLYEYARKNETVEIPERKIEIYDIKLIGLDKKDKTITYMVHCSKGTYIRSLCEQISEKLDTVGYMKKLNRTKVGSFLIGQAISLDEIENNVENENFLKEHIITIEQLFQDRPKIILTDKQLVLFLNGVQLSKNETSGVYRIYNEKGNFIGTGIIENNLLKRDIVIIEKSR